MAAVSYTTGFSLFSSKCLTARKPLALANPHFSFRCLLLSQLCFQCMNGNTDRERWLKSPPSVRSSVGWIIQQHSLLTSWRSNLSSDNQRSNLLPNSNGVISSFNRHWLQETVQSLCTILTWIDLYMCYIVVLQKQPCNIPQFICSEQITFLYIVWP
jgi:hypothetical protein